MIFRKHSTAGLLLATFVATTLSAHAFGLPLVGKKKKTEDVLPARKLTPAQSALIDKAIAREKVVVKTVKERAPLVETYIQNMKPDPVLGQVPESDEHHLARVEFNKIIGDQTYQVNKSTSQGTSNNGKLGFFKNSLSYITGLGGSLHLNFNEAGFVQMILMDSNDFDKQHYAFGYVRNDFLGNTPTAVFDVTPASGKKATGRFFGRIWVETRNGNVVRFNGNFAGQENDYKEFYHFDSWRTNVQPDLWLPTSFYVEESDPKSVSRTLKFKAINHIWGYVLKVPAKETENTSLDVVGATDVSNDAQDVGPLGAQRAWVQQAEDNIVDRLFQAGLLDAPSEFDKTLEALAGNILAYNNITLSRRSRWNRSPSATPSSSLRACSTPPASSPRMARSRWAISTLSLPSRSHTLFSVTGLIPSTPSTTASSSPLPPSSIASPCTTRTPTTRRQPRKPLSYSAPRNSKADSNTLASTCSSSSSA